ncbi:hypothetical protein ACA29_05760 [Lederbergia galactosidilytica]|uniref:Uncharacterized protein n=1 Tax=Lederbergia galactosidilytica TaxID=217031 RepID=A0A0Q9YE89_9BACI|nr:hypothetical protein ACA29_05760 [Lederbergia galactosidilytica]
MVDRLKDHFHEGVEVEEIEDEMVEAFKHVYNQYQNKLSSYKQERFIDPILDVVESLPATELAHIAESLCDRASPYSGVLIKYSLIKKEIFHFNGDGRWPN